MGFRFRGLVAAPWVEFLGPFGRISGRVVFGRVIPDLFWGFKAIESPNALRSLRYTWTVKVDAKTRRVLRLENDARLCKILLNKPMPKELERALRDVFTNHQPAGTRQQEMREHMLEVREKAAPAIAERAALGVPDGNSTPSEWARYYERLKVEDPAAWAALKGESPSTKRHGRAAEGEAR